jgi:monofunctional biosynthetic peptidoglycan transglycosylase
MGQFTFLLSLLSLVAAGILVWKTFQFFRTEFPSMGVLNSKYPKVKYLGEEEEPDVSLEKRRPQQWVVLSEISRTAVGAIVVSEDWAFFQHKGYDANQIADAIKRDWEEGRFVRGASTITQQVVRNVFLSKDKNLWRKLKEVYLAVQLEKVVSKNKILEIYLNIAEWGAGIYGIGPAARFYFSKSPNQLTAKEGAFLAMLLPSPKRYSRSFRAGELTPYARNTIDSILQKMVQAHYLTEDALQREKALPLSFERISGN